jgi:hypothetical protein
MVEEIVEEIVTTWKSKGYTEERHFENEYILLVNPKTMLRVRVYESGAVWYQDSTGTYVKE